MKNVNRLSRKTAAGIAGITVCALVFPAVGSSKNPVTRPVKVSGNMLLVVTPHSDNPYIGDYEFIDWGQASHAGRYSDTATGTIDLMTGEFLTGLGTIVAANGDTITWQVTATEDPNDTPNVVVYTGGTGRFAGVEGGFTAKVTPGQPIAIGEDGSMTFLLTYVGRGDITY